MSAAALGKSKALSTAAAPPPPPPPVAAAAAAAVAAASATAAPGRAALFAALTDALAGALGSVVAVAVFYPIDVAKTRAQASSSPSSSGHARDDHEPIDAASRRGSGEGVAGGREAGWLRSRTLSALVSLVRHEGVSRLYEGIEAKALQSLLGSFIYFYAYAFIKGAMRRRFQRGGGGMPAGSSKSLRPSLNLLAAALAGAINQLFTLPLENITTRMQTAQRTPPFANNTQETEGKCGGVWSDATAAAADNRRGGGGGGGGGDGGDDDHAAAARGGGGGDGGAGERQRRERKRQSLLTVAAELYREGGGIAGGGIARFWRGFVPSLVLTCNPAINYTAFDLLKALWLRRRAAAEAGAGAATAAASATAGVGASAGGGGGSAPGVVVAAGSESFLNPVEAFLVAAAAKSLATLVTYPLIRAKVVLMTSSRSKHAPSSRSCSCSCASCSCYFSSSPPSSSCSCSSRPCCRFSAGRGGGYSDSPTAEHVLDGTNIGIRQQAPERHSVSRGDNSSSPAMCESCVRNSCDAAAAAVVAAVAVAAGAAPAGWEGARGGGGDGDLRGMGTVIVDIFRREGIGGLYAGCGAQLLHTILKSALLLATKEQLARAAASAVLLL
ncbi:unnamed protein product [Laminaria digitata]